LIYTCTLNPAVDYKLEVGELKTGKLNRSTSAEFTAGGKGINVSLILSSLKLNNVALGFTGGFTGQFIKDFLSDKSIKNMFIDLKENTRLNVKIKQSKSETEINQLGPKVTKLEFNRLLKQIEKLNNKDLLICGGRDINGISNPYLEIAKKASIKKVKFVMDISSKEMLKILKYRPFLIKPNIHELGDYFQKELSGVTEAVKYGKKLIGLGAQNLIISMGKEGSLFVTKTKVYQAIPISGDVISSVGAGDSMVAGFIAAYMKSASLVEAYKMAVAAASATTFTQGLANANSIKKYLAKVVIKEVV
jgi:1-phosphofructokinase